MWPKGKPRSAETKAKIRAWSIAHRDELRRSMTDEQRAKLHVAHKSEANIARLREIAESRKGKPRAWTTTAETQEKLRASWIIRKQTGRYNKGQRKVRAVTVSEPIKLDLPEFDGCAPTHMVEANCISSVYAIINSKTGKLYIGSSNDTGRRWMQHRHLLLTGVHHAPILQNAWNKYGADAFVFRLLELVPPDKESLLAAEQRWLDHYHAADRLFGYNSRPIAECPSVAGESNPKAKLTEIDVFTIRQRYDRGDSRAAIARDFNITRATVYGIGKRKGWKHLDDTL